MFEGWGEFFLMVGSAAAVLIGLIFVVVTLMDDRPRSTVLAGSQLYMGPIVLNMSFVLVLSAAALIPGVDARDYAVACAVCALWGGARAGYSLIGIRKLSASDEVHWTDAWFYGVIPLAIYLATFGVVAAFWQGARWAGDGIAAVITALLLLGIRNEWDLVTWLAPKSEDHSSFEKEVEKVAGQQPSD